MDLKVNWSIEAIEDLESIAEYIARDSEFYANSVVSKIISISRDIGEFPYSGRIVPEMNNEKIRERLVYSYRVIYKVEEKEILIVSIIHGKRQL